ncbi:MAG: hypothetical protein V7L20_31205 [Nostoc sp.]|uniref:hypothetical protein n=1 Tax=Nostoc sp. TaxID=1180 RepID=UPI002FFCE0C7
MLIILKISALYDMSICDRTKLTLQTQYFKQCQDAQTGLPAVGTVFPNLNGKIPCDRIVDEPDNYIERTFFSTAYSLKHRLSDNWTVHNRFRYATSRIYIEKAQ